MGRATIYSNAHANVQKISIHALRGEGDLFLFVFFSYFVLISIHALRGEGDFKKILVYPVSFYFNPRPPWGGRLPIATFRNDDSNFNPRPPWGGRQNPPPMRTTKRNFNPRPPWGGRRRRAYRCVVLGRFQSTPSVGRATQSLTRRTLSLSYFNPRPPWGGRRKN